MNITGLEAKVDDFLAQKRIAVAGVSRNNSHHPTGNLIYRRLKGLWPRRIRGESAHADL